MNPHPDFTGQLALACSTRLGPIGAIKACLTFKWIQISPSITAPNETASCLMRSQRTCHHVCFFPASGEHCTFALWSFPFFNWGLYFGARANKRQNANLSNILGMLPCFNTHFVRLSCCCSVHCIHQKIASYDSWPLMHWRIIATNTHTHCSSSHGSNKCNVRVINAHSIKACNSCPLFWSLGSQRRGLNPLLSFRCPRKFALKHSHTSAIHDKLTMPRQVRNWRVLSSFTPLLCPLY